MLRTLNLALRSVARTPGASATVLATSALALGAATLAFTLVEGVLLRPFPYEDGDRIANLRLINRDQLAAAETDAERANAQRFPVSFPVFEAWRHDPGQPFEALGAYTRTELAAPGGADLPPVDAVLVTAGIFDVLGVPAARGRVLTPAEDRVGELPVAVLTHGAWRRRFGADPSILGTDLRFGDATYRVIGVMPPEFYFPDPATEVLVTFPDANRSAGAQAYFLDVLGRLPPAMDATTARRAMEAVGERTRQIMGWTPGTANASVVPRRELVIGDVRGTLLLLFATVAVVLLVACLNIGNVLLVRATARDREFAVRAAIGAGRRRLLTLNLVEGLLLVGGGALLGLAAAGLALDPLLGVLPDAFPRKDEVALNGWVALFAAGAALITAVVAGALPGLRAARSAPADALREGARGAGAGRRLRRLQRGLVAGEVAAAFTLVVGAGLLATSLARLGAVDVGFEPDGFVSITAFLPSAAFGGPAATAWRAAVRDRLLAVPEVEEVTFASGFPQDGSAAWNRFEVRSDDAVPAEHQLSVRWIDERYLGALRIPLVHGRALDRSDAGAADHGVLVSRTAAEQFWPGGDATRGFLRPAGRDGAWHPVVGVVEDVREMNPAEPPAAVVYLPYDGFEAPVALAGIRTAGGAGAMAVTLQQAVAEVDPRARVFDPVVTAAALAEHLHPHRLRTGALVVLSGIAAFLAILGVYAVLAFEVAQRRSEIGVRLALGATGAGIVRGVVRRGLAVSGAGVVAGLAVSLVASRALEGFLFGIGTRHPWTFAGAVALVLAVAALAALLPARAAARLDPARVLARE